MGTRSILLGPLAAALMTFSLVVAAEGNDHGVSGGGTVVNVEAPGGGSGKAEFVGSLQTEVMEDPFWVQRTLSEIESRFGDQAPETLQAVQQALEAIARGEEASGPEAATAQAWISATEEALGRGAGEGITLKARLQEFVPPASQAGSAGSESPRRALPPVARPVNTDILQRTEELSYNSPQTMTATGGKPGSALGGLRFVKSPFEEPIPESQPPEGRAGKVRPNRTGDYGNGGGVADPTPSSGSGASLSALSPGSSGTPGPLVLSPAGSASGGGLQRKIAGTLSRLLGKVQSSRTEESAGASAFPKDGSRRVSRDLPRGSGKEELLDRIFIADPRERPRAKTWVAAVVRPPQLTEQGLTLYYGVLALAWLSTAGFLYYLWRQGFLAGALAAGRSLWPVLGRRKRERGPGSHKEAA